MVETSEGESGELAIEGAHDGDSPAEPLALACHEIVDAASSIIANLEILALAAGGRQTDVVADVRASVELIVELARAIRPRATCSHACAKRRAEAHGMR